jgi:serine/arginine repetitive matrix protein 1
LQQFPDPRILQLNITGFLSRDASQLVLNLWKLLISAQGSIGGIPPQLLNKKKEEIKERMVTLLYLIFLKYILG